jgi:hypothetical protein
MSALQRSNGSSIVTLEEGDGRVDFRSGNACRIHSYNLLSVLTPFVMNLTLRSMGDKSPKATHKQAAQKQAKASAAKKKNNAPSAKQVPKPK